MSFIIRVIAFLLIAESLITASRLTSFLSTLAAYEGTALVLIVLRAALVPLQFAGGWFLAKRQPQGVPLAKAALAGGAALTVFDVGLGLAPSPVYPWWRWEATVLYAAYAAVGVLILGRRPRPGPADKRYAGSID